MDRKELRALSTFDLAFNLATGKYNEEEKFIVLDIIKGRDSEAKGSTSLKKKPLKGSKAEKILELAKAGMKPADIITALKKKKITVYPAEVYRVIKNYSLD